jgi:hypothetical protein
MVKDALDAVDKADFLCWNAVDAGWKNQSMTPQAAKRLESARDDLHRAMSKIKTAYRGCW